MHVCPLVKCDCTYYPYSCFRKWCRRHRTWRLKIQKIRKNRKIESLYSTLYQLAIYRRKASEMHPKAPDSVGNPDEEIFRQMSKNAWTWILATNDSERGIFSATARVMVMIIFITIHFQAHRSAGRSPRSMMKSRWKR